MTCIDEGWEIVLVVYEHDVSGLADTLADIQAQSHGSRVVVLAQDTPVTRAACATLDVPVNYCLESTEGRDAFWASSVSAHTFTAAQTLLVRAGARLPVAWDARLAAVAQLNPRAAVVLPLLARHPFLSAFSQPLDSPRLSVNAVDQWLNDYARGREFSVPVLPPACALLQGEYWREPTTGTLTDAQLRDALAERGQWIVATDQLYVDDSRCDYSPATASLPAAFDAGYQNHHPLASLRHALWELCTRGEEPPDQKDCLPVQLHVGHSWGGGLNRWIENYLAADTTRHHLVLRSIGDKTAFGQQIALYGSADMEVPLRTWVLAQPILSTVVSQVEYQSLLREVVEQFNVESLVISSFIGHSFDLLESALPTTLVLHDFFPFCPALYASFNSPCSNCDARALEKCGRDNPLHRFFEHETAEHWLRVRRAFSLRLQATRPTVIAPTRSVLDRYAALEPSLAQLDTQVIPHGLSGELVANFATAAANNAQIKSQRSPSSPALLRVLVLGRMTSEKGADLLAELIPETADVAEFVLLGAGEGGEKFGGLANCTVIDDYQLGELPEMVSSVRPDMGLLLSVVPETFSYTLSECWALGVPVMATRLGAFSDRIVDGENGWLELPEVKLLVAKLRSVAADHEAVTRVKETVRSQRIPLASDMVAAYNGAYPVPVGVPLRRFHLPRRSFANPYREVEQQNQAMLYIQRTHGVEATYRGVLREFLQYSAQKIQQTQRIPRILRFVLRKFTTLLLRII